MVVLEIWFEQETQFAFNRWSFRKANEMYNYEWRFCHKHKFKTEFVDGNVMIKMEMNG